MVPVVAQAGAGAPGGHGGGATGESDDSTLGRCAGLNTVVVPRSQGATPPPLDPSRKVNVVSCTQPFDPLGKGNLCCS